MLPLDSRRILLVHPLGYGAASAAGDISRKANIMPPLGLAMLAAYVEQRGFIADIVDCYADPAADRGIREYLTDKRPALLGFSCTTSSFLDGARLAAAAKELLPGVTTVFGGAHVSALRELVLRDYPAVDLVVVGEGEETLTELMDGGAAAPSGVPGVVYRDAAGEPDFTGRRTTSLELDSLPLPAYDKLRGTPAPTACRSSTIRAPRTPAASAAAAARTPAPTATAQSSGAASATTRRNTSTTTCAICASATGSVTSISTTTSSPSTARASRGSAS